MDRGYTLLWRKFWDNPVLKERGKRFSRREAWLYLVNKEARGVPMDGLGRGEFRASLRRLGKTWLWSVSSVHKFMTDLTQSGMINRVKSPEHFAEHLTEHFGEHFIVCNYDTYNPLPNTFPNTDPNTLPNNLKEGLKESEKQEKLKASSQDGGNPVCQLPSVEAFQLSERLRKAIATRDPNAKAAKLPDLTHWARDFDKLLRIDGRRAEDCEAVIDWCQNNGCFWGPNILSGKKFREKFDTMWGQMKRADPKPSQEKQQAELQRVFDRYNTDEPTNLAAKSGGGS